MQSYKELRENIFTNKIKYYLKRSSFIIIIIIKSSSTGEVKQNCLQIALATPHAPASRTCTPHAPAPHMHLHHAPAPHMHLHHEKLKNTTFAYCSRCRQANTENILKVSLGLGTGFKRLFSIHIIIKINSVSMKNVNRKNIIQLVLLCVFLLDEDSILFIILPL